MRKTLPNGVTIASDTKIFRVFFAIGTMIIELDDDRDMFIPTSWYPKLDRASQEQRMDYEIIADGTGIHWPQIDEDLSLSGFMAI